MKIKRYGPFTLFLCLSLIAFILLAPHFLTKPDLDKILDKIFVREIEWKGIITIWDYPRLDITTGYKYSWLRNKIKEFERKNPGVFIEFKPLDPEYGHIELETAINTGIVPDIAPVGSQYEIISKGVIEPLDEYLTEKEIDTFKLQAISAVKYDNKIWGIPYMMEPYTLFINTDLFNERNVNIPNNGNWNYEEFVDSLKKLTYDKNNDGKPEIYGFNSFIAPMAYNIWGIILSDGAEVIDQESKRYNFYGKKAISGLQKLADLKLVHGVTPESFGINSKNEAWKSFAIDKKVAVYPAKSSTINEIKKLISMGKGFNFDVVNYPIGDMGIPVSAADTVTAYGVFKQEDKKKTEMCVKFIKHLTNDQSQKELYKQGVFPVKKNIGNIYLNDTHMSKIEKNLTYSKPMGIHKDWRRVDDILQNQIRMALIGKKTVEEAIEDAKKLINEIE